MPRVLPLHPRHCDGSERDVQLYLAKGLQLDPEALNRLSYISHHSYYGCQTKVNITRLLLFGRLFQFKIPQFGNYFVPKFILTFFH